jgi:hypothetical protein
MNSVSSPGTPGKRRARRGLFDAILAARHEVPEDVARPFEGFAAEHHQLRSKLS